MNERNSSNESAISVLHVDDDIQFADMVGLHLERIDDRLTVLTEQGAEAGLERLETASIDCIISDYQMPGIDGLEFLEAVRTEYPLLPFILFTGKGSEEVAAKAINRGVDSYLQKKIGTGQFTVLAQHITTLVGKCRAERRLSLLEQVAHVSDERETTVPEEHEGTVEVSPSREQLISVETVREVAKREGCDPVTLTPPLSDVIDPQALDALFGSTTGEAEQSLKSVTFTYRGYTITISGDKQITITN